MSISQARAIPAVVVAIHAGPFASLRTADGDEPSRTFTGGCPLLLSPDPSTLEGNIMLWKVTPTPITGFGGVAEFVTRTHNG
jgi:hypothetical protein